MPIPLICRTTAAFLYALCLPAYASAQNSPPPDPDKLVELDGFDVKGTRIPAESIIRLSGLKIGQQVNYSIINDACHKITSTGLVKMIDYAYEKYPEKSGVILSLTVTDELPLFSAKIIPPEDTDKIWGCLQSADPIFTRELPNTRAALNFYSSNINRCIEIHGQHDAYVHASVACDVHGNASEIIFHIRPK
jgi:hypothetical protein